MRTKQLQGVYIDPANCIAEARVIQDDLQTFYQLLDCSLIDITSRPIGGFTYDIVCDDEGLLKPDPVVSAVFPDGKPALVGRLFVVRGDYVSGDLVSLSDQDVKRILDNCVTYYPPKGREALFGDFGVAVVIS